MSQLVPRSSLRPAHLPTGLVENPSDEQQQSQQQLLEAGSMPLQQVLQSRTSRDRSREGLLHGFNHGLYGLHSRRASGSGAGLPGPLGHAHQSIELAPGGAAALAWAHGCPGAGAGAFPAGPALPSALGSAPGAMTLAPLHSVKLRRMLCPVPRGEDSSGGGSPASWGSPASSGSGAASASAAGSGSPRGGSGGILAQLLALGEAVDRCDQTEVLRLTRMLREVASPLGAPLERMAHFVLLCLERRARGCTALEYVDWPNLLEEEEITKFLHFATREPVLPFGFATLASGVLDAAMGQPRVHIIDFACWAGQWPRVIKQLASGSNSGSASGTGSGRGSGRGSQTGGGGACKLLKFTAVTAPPGHPLSLGPVANISGLHSELQAACKLHSISLRFQAVVCTAEGLQPSSLQLEPGDAVIVNLSGRLTAMAKAAAVLPHPRDTALRRVLQIQPRAVLMLEWDVNQQDTSFLLRYKQAVAFYSKMFECHEGMASRDDVGRWQFEQRIQYRPMLNFVACEGLERVVCSEGLHQLQSRMARIGFAPRPFSQAAMKRIEDVGKAYPPGFAIKFDEFNGCSLLWDGTASISASVWQPKVSPQISTLTTDGDFGL